MKLLKFEFRLIVLEYFICILYNEYIISFFRQKGSAWKDEKETKMDERLGGGTFPPGLVMVVGVLFSIAGTIALRDSWWGLLPLGFGLVMAVSGGRIHYN